MKYKADEILKFIDEMENEERWKLLEKMYFKFYNKEQFPEDNQEEEEY